MTNIVYLHIGMPKTGTSALQVFFAANQESLKQSGVWYPTSANLQAAKSGAVTSGNATGIARFLNPDNPHPEDPQEALERFQDELKQNSGTILYSSEFLHNASPERLQQLKSVATSLGHEIRIVVFLRHQIDIAFAQYSQGVKRHALSTSSESILDRPGVNYLEILNRFSAIFGDRNIIARDYAHFVESPYSLMVEFLSILGLAPGNQFQFPKLAVNPSLSRHELEMLRGLNELTRDPAVCTLVSSVLMGLRASTDSEDAYLGMIGSEKLLPSQEELTRLTRRYREENDEISVRFLGGRPFRGSGAHSSGKPLDPPTPYERILFYMLSSVLFSLRART